MAKHLPLKCLPSARFPFEMFRTRAENQNKTLFVSFAMKFASAAFVLCLLFLYISVSTFLCLFVCLFLCRSVYLFVWSWDLNRFPIQRKGWRLSWWAFSMHTACGQSAISGPLPCPGVISMCTMCECVYVWMCIYVCRGLTCFRFQFYFSPWKWPWIFN